MSLDRESICEFVKFENSEKNNKYRAGSMKKKPQWSLAVYYTKSSCLYRNGMLYSWLKYKEPKCRAKISSALPALIEYSIKKLSFY